MGRPTRRGRSFKHYRVPQSSSNRDSFLSNSRKRGKKTVEADFTQSCLWGSFFFNHQGSISCTRNYSSSVKGLTDLLGRSESGGRAAHRIKTDTFVLVCPGGASNSENRGKNKKKYFKKITHQGVSVLGHTVAALSFPPLQLVEEE